MNRAVLFLFLFVCYSSSSGQTPQYINVDPGNLQYLIGGFNGLTSCPQLTLDYSVEPNTLVGTEHGGSLSYGQHISALHGSLGAQFSYFNNDVYNVALFDLVYNYNLRVSRRWTVRLGLSAGVGQENNSVLEEKLLNPRGELSILAYSSAAFFGFSYQRSNFSGLSLVGGKSIGFGRFSIYPIFYSRYEYPTENEAFHRWTSGLTVPVYYGKMIFGASTTVIHSSNIRFGGLVGRKFAGDNLSIIYAYGSAGPVNPPTEFYVDNHHQISLRWQLSCKPKKRTFRTISCPSFGGGSGMAVRVSGSIGSNPVRDGVNSIEAGTLTAAHINDFAKWELWKDISAEDLKSHQKTWKIEPRERFTVHVVYPDGRPVVDASAKLLDEEGNEVWHSRTDNLGKAELWNGMYGKSIEPTVILIEAGSERFSIDHPKKFQDGLNKIIIDQPCHVPENVDVFFAVDATGSMDDEMDYLKTELDDIIKQVTKDQDIKMNLGAMVYRCFGNEYVTRYSDLSADVEKTLNFLERQSSGEGGLEAVEVALEEAIVNQRWSSEARARILFIVLDEPPGNKDEMLASMEVSIRKASEKGIRIVPLIASGANKSLEYLMRSIALATNGSCAFLTDHSGVGDEHLKPTTDEYDVELLNKMMIRLIKEYMYVPECNSPFPVSPEKTDTVKVDIIAHVVVDSSRVQNDTMNTDEDESSVPQTREIRKAFKFYPNPTADQLTIEIKGEMDYLYLCDMSGRLIRRIKVDGLSRLRIDISDLTPGIYLIQYRSGVKSFTGKLIKS